MNTRTLVPAMSARILVGLVGLVGLGVGCTSYTSVVAQENGKLLVSYQKGGLGFYSGGIYECSRKGQLELDCKELFILLPTVEARVTEPALVTEIMVDPNNLDGSAAALRGWLGRTVAVKVSDGNLLTGSLAEVKGAGADILLVLNTERGPLAVRLTDAVRVTALQRAQ